MVRFQALEQLKDLKATVRVLIDDEDLLEDIEDALDFAIADMETLQDVLTCVDGVMKE